MSWIASGRSPCSKPAATGTTPDIAASGATTPIGPIARAE